MPDEAHVELVRSKLTEKYGSLWKAAREVSFGTMSGAELLTSLRNLPMHSGHAATIEQEIGLNPNSFVKKAQA